jgi:predicted DNA-binding transcriptional regulator AlpA
MNSPTDGSARILRPKEAARYLGLSVSTLAKMRCRGDGPNYIQLGRGAIGYRVADLDQYAADRVRKKVR